MKEYDKLIFEISRPGRKGYELPADRSLWNCPRSASWMW